MRRLVAGLGWVVGLFLVGRAIAEPFTIDLANPATYEADWGGPSLIGVLAVHMLPGVVSAVLMVRTVGRRQRGDSTSR